MVLFSTKLTIASLSGQDSREVEALVDTGARYSMLPGNMLRDLGINVVRVGQFAMADGRVHELPVGEARIAINGGNAPTFVIFGPDDSEPLLGAYTLEGLELIVDPVHKQLMPAAGPYHL